MNRLLALIALSPVVLHPVAAAAVTDCSHWKSNPKTFFTNATSQDVNRCISSGADVNFRYDKLATPLHYAAMYSGKPEVIEALLIAGATVNATSQHHSTPLLMAASYHPTIELVSKLIDGGANVGIANLDGMTPLHSAAAWATDPAVINKLIEAGANLEARNKDGLTPLHAAADTSRTPNVVLRLIRAGADLDARTKRGRTPSYLAQYNSTLTGTHPRHRHDAQGHRKRNAERAARAAEARQRREADRKRRQEEIEGQRTAKEQRRAEEAERRRAEIEKRRAKERALEGKRLNRIETETARILAQRQECRPSLDPVGLWGAFMNEGSAIEALEDLAAEPAAAYVVAIPFILAGPEKHPEVEEALRTRILHDIDSWDNSDWRKQLDIIVASWTAAFNTLKDNCLFDLADFLVLSVVETQWREFRTIIGHRLHSSDQVVEAIMTLLANVPPNHFEYKDKHYGALPDDVEVFREMSALADERERLRFTESICLTYFREQSKLQTGDEFTELKRKQVTILCNCFYDGIENPYDFELIVSIEHAFSRRRLRAVEVLGTCAMRHGLNTRQ